MTEVVIDHLTDTDQRGGEKTVISSFVSRQSLNLSIKEGADGKMRIDGPVDTIKWDDVERLARVVHETLVRASIFEDSGLTIAASLESAEGRWNPKISLVTSADNLLEHTIHQTRSVVSTVMDCLMRGRNAGTQLIDSEITEGQMQVVHAVTSAALAANGGRALHAEVQVNILEEAVAKVKGKLGPKPDRSNFSPQPVDLTGEFVGFHAGSELMFFLDGLKGEVRLAYGRTQVDLQQITELIVSRQRVDVRTHRTINKAGAELLAFVSLKVEAQRPAEKYPVSM